MSSVRLNLPSPPTIVFRNAPEVAVVVMAGEHDLGSADKVLAAIEAALPDQNVVVDLNETTFIDSFVIGALVRGWQSANAAGRTFHLCLGGEHPRRMDRA